MNRYYFLLCSLPPINIGVNPYITFSELENYLEWNLSDKDKLILSSFMQYIDIKNLLNIWRGNNIDLRGNLDEKELSEVLQTEDYFPSFVFEYLKKNESVDSKISNFASLENDYLKYQISKSKNDFIRSYFTFERETRLVLSALRSKKIGVDISNTFSDEDKKDPIVDNIILQKDENIYHPPKEFETLKNIYLKNQDDPKTLHKGVLEYFFNKYFELTEKDLFNIDQILGYIANLIMVEDYNNLDHDQGKSLVDSML